MFNKREVRLDNKLL